MSPDPQLAIRTEVRELWASPKAARTSANNLEIRKSIEAAIGDESYGMFEARYQCVRQKCGDQFTRLHSFGALTGKLVSGAMTCPVCNAPSMIVSRKEDFSRFVQGNAANEPSLESK